MIWSHTPPTQRKLLGNVVSPRLSNLQKQSYSPSPSESSTDLGNVLQEEEEDDQGSGGGALDTSDLSHSGDPEAGSNSKKAIHPLVLTSIYSVPKFARQYLVSHPFASETAIPTVPDPQSSASAALLRRATATRLASNQSAIVYTKFNNAPTTSSSPMLKEKRSNMFRQTSEGENKKSRLIKIGRSRSAERINNPTLVEGGDTGRTRSTSLFEAPSDVIESLYEKKSMDPGDRDRLSNTSNEGENSNASNRGEEIFQKENEMEQAVPAFSAHGLFYFAPTLLSTHL